MLWDCEECGVKAIAGGLNYCPTCRTPRPTQDVAEEPTQPPAPDGETGESYSAGTFPADDEGQAPPSHNDQEEEEEEDGADHDQ